jgi:hypothetical protein
MLPAQRRRRALLSILTEATRIWFDWWARGAGA